MNINRINLIDNNRVYLLGFLIVLMVLLSVFYIYFVSLSLEEGVYKNKLLSELNLNRQNHQNLQASYLQELSKSSDKLEVYNFVKADNVKFINAMDGSLARVD